MGEESLFAAALERVAGSERRAFLERVCAGDEGLRRRLELLLAAHEASTGILDDSADQSGTTTVDSPDYSRRGPVDERPDAVVADRYKLLEAVGEGGMGTVWAAEQIHPVRRKVALKLIKAGMDSRNVLARFDAERQALAIMDHPNIAKVLDGGTTEGGRPFFVMEYVSGVPLTQYCDDARLSIAQRLELFVAVCQAVQHAHTKGVVHRDLKPGNVLVGVYDGRPLPKVIDFGLAKAMHRPLTDYTLHTAQGVMMGTPLYISPEQAEFHNPDVDTRTDVYALGVILYELLTGTTPLESQRFHEADWQEVLRLIKEEDPPRPSVRLSGSGSLPILAARRQLEPARLTRLVRGELDWIVMKCLEKDRARRYETADGLAHDVQRYLTDEPVEACPPSTGYRLGKFLRRNREPALAASIILVLLVGGIVGTTWGLVQARRARDAEAIRAESERKAVAQALKRLRQVEQGSEILASVFNDLDPRAEEKDGRPLRTILGDRLARAAEQLEGEGVGDPLLVAGLQNRLGLSMLHLGLGRGAIPLFEKARATRATLLGLDDPNTLDSMNNVGRAFHDDGKLDKAVPLLEEAYKLMKARVGAGDPKTLTIVNNLATAYLDDGKLDRALPLYEETFQLQKAGLGPDHSETLSTMNNLALSYQADGRMPKAMPLLEEALRLRKARFGPHHADTFNSMNSLADGYRADGKLGRALTLWEETLELRKAHLGPDHPDTLTTMSNLAAGYRTDNQLEKALPLLEEAYKLIKAKRGPDHLDTLTAMSNLAVGYRTSNQLGKALTLLEEAFRLARARTDPDHFITLGIMSNLATAYRADNRLDEALPLFEEILRMRKARQGADNPDTLISMSNLAAAYRADNQLDKALLLWEEALRLTRARMEADHPITLTMINNLAAGYRAAGKIDQALPLLREAAAGIEKRRFRDAVAGKVINNLIDTQEELGQFAEAEAWRRKWISEVKKKAGADSLLHAGELGALGANLLRQERWTDAELVLREALAIREAKETDAWATHLNRSLLGGALMGQKKYDEAETELIRGFEGVRPRVGQMPPPDRSRVAEAGERVVRLYEAWGRPEKAAEWRTKLSGPDGPGPKP